MAFSPNTTQNPTTPGQNPGTPRQGPGSVASHYEVNPGSFGLPVNPGTPHASTPYSAGNPRTPGGLQNVPYGGGPGTPGASYNMLPRTPGQLSHAQDSWNAAGVPPHMMVVHNMRGGMPMRGYMPTPDPQFGPPRYGIPTQALAGMPGGLQAGMQIPPGYQHNIIPQSSMLSNAPQQIHHQHAGSGLPAQYGPPPSQQHPTAMPPQAPPHSSGSESGSTGLSTAPPSVHASQSTVPFAHNVREQDEIRAQQRAQLQEQANLYQRQQAQQALLLAQQRQRHLTSLAQNQLPAATSGNQPKYLSLPPSERRMLQSVKIARHHLHEVFTHLMHLLKLTSEVDLPGTAQLSDGMSSVSKNTAVEKIRRLNESHLPLLMNKVDLLKKLHELIMTNIGRELSPDILNDLSTGHDTRAAEIMADAHSIERLQEQSQKDLPPEMKALLTEYNEVYGRAVAKRTAVRQLMEKTRDVMWSIDLTIPPILNENQN